jgi:hypothetical protein
MMPYHPVADGNVLPAPPIDRIAAGASANVDVLVGTNADNWRYSPVLDRLFEQITEDILAGPAEAYGFWSVAEYGLDAESVLPHYRAATRFGNAPGEALAAVMTDWGVRVPALSTDASAATAPPVRRPGPTRGRPAGPRTRLLHRRPAAPVHGHGDAARDQERAEARPSGADEDSRTSDGG